MLRAKLSDGTFLMGLDRVNINRLTKGEPIAIALQPMGGTDTIIIMFGETLADIKTQWEKANHGPLPPPVNWEQLTKKVGQ